ncbi:LapA family protein [Candidatus Parcubacteria bacterium]|nr:LapA family protein [Candidatus Parcubacteria bacterium]
MIFLLIGLVLGGFAVIFALQNITVITVTFLAWQIDGSLAIILIAAVVTGILIGVLVSIPSAIRRSFLISRIQKKTIALKEELHNKTTEVESARSKLEANNAYLDDLAKHPKV